MRAVTVMSARLGYVLTLAPRLAVRCSKSHSVSANPCALLTRQEVANAVGGQADVGRDPWE